MRQTLNIDVHRLPALGAASLIAAALAQAPGAQAQSIAGSVPVRPAQLQAAQGQSQAAVQAQVAPQATAQAPQANAPAPQPQPPAGCDAACVRANAELASQLCAPRVEAEAPTDFEWVSRPFAKIFQQAEAPEGTATVVRYRGDSIRFLSPQKEWVRVTYECGFDAAKRSVAYVRVRLGRLDQAAPAGPQAGRPQQPVPPPAQAQVQGSQGQPQGQQQGPAAAQVKRLRPSEPSEIEIRQVDGSARQARP
ncbi:hypothetical protein [Methylobacterium sp. A54F]